MHTARLHSFLLHAMTTPRVSDIVGIVNDLAPFRFAEEWDNAGLQVGDPAAPADRIIVALDAGKDTVEAAVAAGCNLLLTHHPLIFRPVKRVSTIDPVGALLALALKNDLAIISLHTNFDIADGGVNDILAGLLGITNCVPLKVTESEEFIKLSVFVPKGHEEKIMDALFKYSGFIGNYSECSFCATGIGTFRPLKGAKPFIGKVGKREYTEEVRLEVLLRNEDLAPALKTLLASHPYEEPAYDLYPLLNMGKAVGLGRLGELSAPVTLTDFAKLTKERLKAERVRYVGEGGRMLSKVALCGGSGASLLREAAGKGADLLVTGDVKYHEAREAESIGLALVDAGHFATEFPMVKGLKELIGRELAKRGHKSEITSYEGEREPFSYI